jgi:hypothetical protein
VYISINACKEKDRHGFSGWHAERGRPAQSLRGRLAAVLRPRKEQRVLFEVREAR